MSDEYASAISGAADLVAGLVEAALAEGTGATLEKLQDMVGGLRSLPGLAPELLDDLQARIDQAAAQLSGR